MVNPEVDGRKFPTDALARKLMQSMLSDYRASFGSSDQINRFELSFLTDIRQFRDFEFTSFGIVEPYRFKMRNQLENLLKKYKFADDKFTEIELKDLTLEKYFKEQLRILTPNVRLSTTHMVLQRARKIARSILGKFDIGELTGFCKFGKKSSIGCPLGSAYLDIKLSKQTAFTSSTSCASKVFDLIEGDAILKEIISKIDINPKNLAHDTLNLICVPKSWKINRLITPLTLLGLFYSNGLGGYVANRLSENGLKIPHLQAKHRNLVKRFSMDCSHATADLSSASDSITIELLCAILPRDWFVALKPLFTHTVLYKEGENHEVQSAFTASVLPMGNGATFPLETLVFYSLIKAIGTLTGVHGIYSVYGDDLIYPSKIHKYVCRVFANVGLTMNLDKTFVHYPFRESCGSDFYRGVDVRSFYFEGDAAKLSRTRYRALLHKTYNGLSARWAPEELPHTFSMLLTELGNLGKVLRIPPRYPDEAGIKVSCHSHVPMALTGVEYEPIYVKHNGLNFSYLFKCLEYVTERRIVEVVLPYYWLALQGLNDDLLEGYHTPEPFTLQSSLAWTKQRRTIFYIGKGGRKRRKILKVFVPTVDSRLGGRHKMSNGSTAEWI